MSEIIELLVTAIRQTQRIPTWNYSHASKKHKLVNDRREQVLVALREALAEAKRITQPEPITFGIPQLPVQNARRPLTDEEAKRLHEETVAQRIEDHEAFIQERRKGCRSAPLPWQPLNANEQEQAFEDTIRAQHQAEDHADLQDTQACALPG